ncbi:MAG: methylmalonyl Co-A mutase-associated GTPase MeaB [Actinobacteria bacterium]|nr:methylmalonyl Co-A mutase-associated GTPase MeaB [Actinomycetota bacterium]
MGRLISLIEDGVPAIGPVMHELYVRTGHVYSVGVTGAPGAGKSTLTERLIAEVRRYKARVGVLAIDPTSPFSGGALLGDRVRMQGHATDRGVFIRSMATRGHLGGLSLATFEAMHVLEAAGIDAVIVETVGVGQAEVEIADACDTTVVVVNPGWGDAIQTAKAGLLEVADIFVVNKADRPGARETTQELTRMLELAEADWRPEIVQTIATKGEGIEQLWTAIEKHHVWQDETGRLESRRRARTQREIKRIVAERYRRRVEEELAPMLSEMTHEVAARRIDPYEAADLLMDAIEKDDQVM